MTRFKKSEIHQIKKELADIVFNHKDEIKFIDGKPSPTDLADKLVERGYKLSRQSVAKFIDEGLDKYRQTLIIEDNDTIRDIKEAMKVQKQIWNNASNKPSDRSKAANSWKSLNNQLIKYEEQLADARIKKAEALKPNYLIKIEPPNALQKCPKCGHEWYDMKDHDENKIKGKWKPAFDKDCDEQKTFDDLEDEKDED